MTVNITVTRESGYGCGAASVTYAVAHTEWRSEVALLETDPDVRQIVARQVEPIVHYAYNRAS